MIIAVDFDGTIVKHKYPSIGKEIPFAIQTLKLLQENGHRLILWTYRSGKELDESVEFCRERGLTFHAVNNNYEYEEFDNSYSRKIFADIYIDDRNLMGIPGWGEIYNIVMEMEKKSQENKFFKITSFISSKFRTIKFKNHVKRTRTYS